MKIKSISSVIVAFVVVVSFGLYQAVTTLKTVSEVYVFGYPLILMEKTKEAMLKTDLSSNQFLHLQLFPDHEFRNVVRPNNDTLYSIAWLDLSGEPLVLSVPELGGRYFVMPFMDAWTNVFASVGQRETGSGAGEYMITGPGWRGEVPSGVRHIESPTPMVWLLGRIQANGPDDVPTVAGFQQGFKLQSLDQWKMGVENPAVIVDTPIAQGRHSPNTDIQAMSLGEYLETLSELMIDNPPQPADPVMMEKLAKLDIQPGQYFDPDSISLWEQTIGKLAVKLVHRGLYRELKNPSNLQNGWMIKTEGLGRYGTDYIVRFAVSQVGLGALPAEEAIYPNTSLDSSGQPLSGENSYRLHFAKGETPPADAFWSLTMYDSEGFLVENPIRRFSIGDRDELNFNPDGSLDLLIQHEPPESASENWLPAPDDAFALTLRVYLPTERVLRGEWILPAVQRVDSL